MKRIVEKSGCAVLIALAFIASGTMAAQTTANFLLTSHGSSQDIMGGVYTAPYGASINGGPTAPVICDDFADSNVINEEWTAYVNPLSGVGTTDMNLKWSGYYDASGTYHANQSEAYTVAAILALDVLNASTPTVEEEYSYALWALFDYSTTNPQDPGALQWLTTLYGANSTYVKAVETDLTTAIGQYSNASTILAGRSVTIYSYDTGATCETGKTCSNFGPPAQEFIEFPEPSSLVVFGFYFLFGGASLLFFRRRGILKKANS